MIQSIKNTLKRLSGRIYIFNPIKWYPSLLEGLSVEFGRVRDYKNQILSATVPNDNMTPDSIEDHNNKYGIPQTLGGTDQEKIQRIIEKAALTGFPGPDWIEEQIQKAGFLLYVIENKVLDQNLNQLGDFQLSTLIQLGPTTRFIDPDTIPGKLVVGSPPKGVGKLYISQLGDFQLDDYQIGTADPDALNPQPFVYQRTNDQLYWGFYFTFSPFPDRVAVDESEFLVITQSELDYLCQIIIELKLQRNWCILQAKAV